MSDETYSTHPQAKQIAGFRLALDIIARHSAKGEGEGFFLEADHDIIYSHLNTEAVEEDSEDGLLLNSLGWYVYDEVWAYNC